MQPQPKTSEGSKVSAILKPVAPANVKAKPRSKITVIGVGSVGMAAAFALMKVAAEICLLDVAEDRVKAEVLDLQHGQQLIQNCNIRGGTKFADSANSDIVVMTAGARQEAGESRLNLVQRNVDILKKTIPEIVKYSPNCILVIVTNPVDVLTYAAAKLSGFPKHRVIGTGTMLDSARFRFLLGERFGVSASSVHGYVIGEHGDTSVPVWSTVNIAGVKLMSVNKKAGTPGDPDKLDEIHKNVVQSAYEIIKLKGYTSWAIGLTCRTLCNAILNNTQTVYPLSTAAKGFHGIQDDVYLSLPCLVDASGISHVIPQKLIESEAKKVQQSAKTLMEVINGVKW